MVFELLFVHLSVYLDITNTKQLTLPLQRLTLHSRREATHFFQVDCSSDFQDGRDSCPLLQLLPTPDRSRLLLALSLFLSAALRRRPPGPGDSFLAVFKMPDEM